MKPHPTALDDLDPTISDEGYIALYEVVTPLLNRSYFNDPSGELPFDLFLTENPIFLSDLINFGEAVIVPRCSCSGCSEWVTLDPAWIDRDGADEGEEDE